MIIEISCKYNIGQRVYGIGYLTLSSLEIVEGEIVGYMIVKNTCGGKDNHYASIQYDIGDESKIFNEDDLFLTFDDAKQAFIDMIEIKVPKIKGSNKNDNTLPG